LRTSRVLVCMLSPAYLASVHNGREVSVFDQRVRLALDTSRAPRAFLPVIWSPVPVDEIPEPLANIEISGDLPPEYRREGLRYLMRLRRFEDAYTELIIRLTRALEEIYRSEPLPLLDNLPEPQDIPNAFAKTAEVQASRTGGPQHLYCAFVVA